jgi:hypothetical protein
MSRSAADITQDALKLPQNEQFKLARTLLEHATLQNDAGVDVAWNDEIERRIAAIDAGVAKGRPFSEVLAELDQRLRRQ